MTDVTSATDASQTDSAGPQPETAAGEWCAAVENGGGAEKGASCPDNSASPGNTQLPQTSDTPRYSDRPQDGGGDDESNGDGGGDTGTGGDGSPSPSQPDMTPGVTEAPVSAGHRIVQGEAGPEIAGPVQVQNRVEVQFRAKVSFEEGSGQLTAGYDGQKRQWYGESKTMLSSTNVDGSGTGLRLGLADNGDRLGSTSAPNALDGTVQALDAIGMRGGFAGAELYAKTDTNVTQTKVTRQGVQTPEAFTEVNEQGLRLTGNGMVDVGPVDVRISAEPLRLAREQKIQPGENEATTPYKPVTKATISASVTATDQQALVPGATPPDQRSLPNGTQVDVNQADGRTAYDAAVVGDAADGTTHFHFQETIGGVSNAALFVPTFDYAGGSAPRTVQEGWLDERTVVHAPATDPNRISRIEQTDWFGNTKTLVPLDAAADWAKAQAARDPHMANLQILTAADLERANPGRVVEVTIPDGNGGMRSVKALEAGDVVNLGFATVQGEEGIYRAPDLRNGAAKAEVELFFDQAQTQVAQQVEPGAIRTDGSVDQARLYSRVGIQTFNGAVETVIESPFGIVQGGANLIATGADWIGQGNDWLMDRASDTVAQSPLHDNLAGDAVNGLIEVNRTTTRFMADGVESVLHWGGDALGNAGDWLGDQYYHHLGYQMDAAHWEAYEGAEARQRIWTAHAPEAQGVLDAQTAGAITPEEANRRLQAIQTQADSEWAQVQQTMPERLRQRLGLTQTPQPADAAP